MLGGSRPCRVCGIAFEPLERFTVMAQWTRVAAEMVMARDFDRCDGDSLWRLMTTSSLVARD